jgi:hypothetical protein
MTNPCQTIDSLFQHLNSCLQNADLQNRPSKPLLNNIALMTYSIVASRNVQLPKLALRIPLKTTPKNLVQRLERLLKNPHFDEHSLYAPFAQAILRQVQQGYIRIVLDRTDINDRHYLLVLSLVFRGRTIPLAWQMLPHEGATSYAQQEALLERVLPWIPSTAEVILLADREFDSAALMDFCLTEGWHFCIRLKKDRRLENREGESFQPKDLKLLPWGTRFLKGVSLADLPGESLSLSCALEGKEAWYILSDLACGPSLLKHYSCRFCTEETFRDWKESGFRLEQTHLVVAERVSRLLFCLCLAHLWSLWRGERGMRGGERRQLESKKVRRLSLLQIGLRLLERAMAMGERIPVGTRVALK